MVSAVPGAGRGWAGQVSCVPESGGSAVCCWHDPAAGRGGSAPGASPGWRGCPRERQRALIPHLLTVSGYFSGLFAVAALWGGQSVAVPGRRAGVSEQGQLGDERERLCRVCHDSARRR